MVRGLTKTKKTLITFIFIAALVSVAVIYIPRLTAVDLITTEVATSTPAVPKPRVATHVAEPSAVKAIYMTACVASTRDWRENMKVLIDQTELNAVVIDIKDSTGSVSFGEYDGGSGCKVKDMQDFIDHLHSSNIYVIGRISVFQDPLMTKLHPEWAVKKHSDGGVWKDRKGLSFIDVGARGYWDFIIQLSKDSYNIGFDEINFDYIRYPSDGDMKDAHYTLSGTSTKPAMLKNFFEYLHKHVSKTGAVMSADLFGMTTTNTDDLNIGQVMENAFPYFDYIAPMVYPSHYPAGFNGWTNPNAVPYEIVNFSMKKAMERLKFFNDNIASTTVQFRPWLQDNDYPVPYTAEMVRAQIKATYDAGIGGWMLWDAGNTYTKSALLPE